jgi:hypothetical protein
MARDPHNIKFVITDLAKDRKQYDLVPLTRKDAAYVMHSSLRTVLKGLAEASGKSTSGFDTSALLKALSEIEFETLWSIARVILRGAQIKNVVKGQGEITLIDDLDDTDYFTENPDELYLAVYHGVIENYPKVFSKVRDLFGDLVNKISDRTLDQTSLSETSDTA